MVLRVLRCRLIHRLTLLIALQFIHGSGRVAREGLEAFIM